VSVLKQVVHCTDGASILKYVRHENAPAAAPTGSQTSDESVEWLDDDELLSSEHLDSCDSEVLRPKKPKLR